MRAGTLFLHIVFFVVTLEIVAWLFWLNSVPSGDVTYTQDFVHRNAFVSDLWPPEALLSTDNGARPFVKDEVTFFVRPPRLFERAQMVFDFKTLPAGLRPHLFIQTSQQSNSWQELEWQYSRETRDGLKIYYQATFSIPANWRTGDKRYNMKIRVPGLEKQKKPVYVEEISARFLDPHATLGTLWHLLTR
jgi:hypothetical protein